MDYTLEDLTKAISMVKNIEKKDAQGDWSHVWSHV